MVFRLELTRQILSAESIKLPPDSQNGQIDFYQTARASKRTNIKQNEWKDGTENFKIIYPLILPFIMIKVRPPPSVETSLVNIILDGAI